MPTIKRTDFGQLLRSLDSLSQSLGVADEGDVLAGGHESRLAKGDDEVLVQNLVAHFVGVAVQDFVLQADRRVVVSDLFG